jgi:hypothetical protein
LAVMLDRRLAAATASACEASYPGIYTLQPDLSDSLPAATPRSLPMTVESAGSLRPTTVLWDEITIS